MTRSMSILPFRQRLDVWARPVNTQQMFLVDDGFKHCML